MILIKNLRFFTTLLKDESASKVYLNMKSLSFKKMNMFQAVNSGIINAMEDDKDVIVFGEDVAFGGVFRCTNNLLDKFGPKRVFNSPLTEQGIVGFAVGVSLLGGKPITEIQFADYIFPAMDQFVNEISKYRYRSGGKFNCGSLVIRAPCGSIGHGGHYHSQSPESYFTQIPGLRVVIPRGPIQAKGLLLASVKSQDPVLFLEPKKLYRSTVEYVPEISYEIELGKGELLYSGNDCTLLGWGNQIHILEKAMDRAKKELGITCDLIDLRSLSPWDKEIVKKSVQKTRRLIISHEAPITGGFAGEISAKISEECFKELKKPIKRVCGWDTPFPYIYEPLYLPGITRCFNSIKEICSK